MSVNFNSKGAKVQPNFGARCVIKCNYEMHSALKTILAPQNNRNYSKTNFLELKIPHMEVAKATGKSPKMHGESLYIMTTGEDVAGLKQEKLMYEALNEQLKLRYIKRLDTKAQNPVAAIKTFGK
jgi:hypothetical protein